jgi:hypothetical protein
MKYYSYICICLTFKLDKMKLELKNIAHSPRLSQETEAFAADLWVNNKKVAYVENSGHGGCTNYNTYDVSLRPLLKEVEDFCKGLPPEDFNGHKLNMDLEFMIDKMLYDWIEYKDYKKALIYRTKEGVKMECKWNGYTITKLLQTGSGVGTIRRKVIDLKSKGCTILNTNLGSIIN